MKRSELKFILITFFFWRVGLFLVAFLAGIVIPVFGARFPYWDRVLTITGLPNWIWGWGNFDGVHYLRIAQDGYSSEFTNAFFPLYPILIRFLSFFFPKVEGLDLSIYTDPSYFYSGFLLSNVLTIFTLLLFYKLVRLDFSGKIAKKSIVIFLAFPTAFYLGGIYTESLFLLLVIGSIYLLRKRYFVLGGVAISLACATRVVGVLLLPVYLIEVIRIFQSKSKISWTRVFLGFLISPIGILTYSLYLQSTQGDLLYFLSVQPKFGAERSSELVFLPQVFYRYFKIFLNVPFLSLNLLNAFLEFVFFTAPFVYLVINLKRVRTSYVVFSLTSILMPTLTGTFSSMPRYSLMAFLVLPWLSNIKDKYFWVLAIMFASIEIVLVAMFIRGYWVA